MSAEGHESWVILISTRWIFTLFPKNLLDTQLQALCQGLGTWIRHDPCPCLHCWKGTDPEQEITNGLTVTNNFGLLQKQNRGSMLRKRGQEKCFNRGQSPGLVLARSRAEGLRKKAGKPREEMTEGGPNTVPHASGKQHTHGFTDTCHNPGRVLYILEFFVVLCCF